MKPIKLPKTPYHEREFLYRWHEVVKFTGMAAPTVLRYRKLEPFNLPVSKAFVANWKKRTGYPRVGGVGKGPGLLRLRLMYELRTKKHWPFKRIAKHFGVKIKTVYNLWRRNPFRKHRYPAKPQNMAPIYQKRCYAKRKRRLNAS